MVNIPKKETGVDVAAYTTNTLSPEEGFADLWAEANGVLDTVVRISTPYIPSGLFPSLSTPIDSGWEVEVTILWEIVK